MLVLLQLFRRAIKTKAPVRVQVLLTLEGGGVKEQEALALLSKKGGGRASAVIRQFFTRAF